LDSEPHFRENAFAGKTPLLTPAGAFAKTRKNYRGKFSTSGMLARGGGKVRVRVSKKYTLYIPKAIAEAVGIREGDIVEFRVKGSRIIVEPALDAFGFALKGPKFARTTFEELERESEEMQRELFG